MARRRPVSWGVSLGHSSGLPTPRLPPWLAGSYPPHWARAPHFTAALRHGEAGCMDLSRQPRDRETEAPRRGTLSRPFTRPERLDCMLLSGGGGRGSVSKLVQEPWPQWFPERGVSAACRGASPSPSLRTQSVRHPGPLARSPGTPWRPAAGLVSAAVGSRESPLWREAPVPPLRLGGRGHAGGARSTCQVAAVPVGVPPQP